MNSRLTTVLTMYHCIGKGQPVYFEDRRSVDTRGKEKMYVRTYEVDGESTLDTGWVQDPSLVVLRNEGKGDVLVMGCILLKPNETAQFRPLGFVPLQGTSELTVVAVP